MPIPEHDEYYMGIAIEVMRRCSCLRHAVGAVIVLKNRVVSTGYNGTAQDLPNCFDGGCDRCKDSKAKTGESYDTCVCVHAEANAIVAAARHGVAIDGATLYTTMHPCFGCMKEALQAGIAAIYFVENWSKVSSPQYQNFLKPSRVKPVRVENEKLIDRVEVAVERHDEDVVHNLLANAVTKADRLPQSTRDELLQRIASLSEDRNHESNLRGFRDLADELAGRGRLSSESDADKYLDIYLDLDAEKWSLRPRSRESRSGA